MNLVRNIPETLYRAAGCETASWQLKQYKTILKQTIYGPRCSTLQLISGFITRIFPFRLNYWLRNYDEEFRFSCMNGLIELWTTRPRRNHRNVLSANCWDTHVVFLMDTLPHQSSLIGNFPRRRESIMEWDSELRSYLPSDKPIIIRTNMSDLTLGSTHKARLLPPREKILILNFVSYLLLSCSFDSEYQNVLLAERCSLLAFW